MKNWPSKTVFSSQDGKQIVFLPSSMGYLYMFGSFENLYFYLNRHHTAEHKHRGRQSYTYLRFQR